jgi:hypothetical protein
MCPILAGTGELFCWAIAVQDFLHIVDEYGPIAARGPQSGEDLAGNLLLVPEITAGVADLYHGRVLALQRDVRTLRPGDVVIVELVAADVNRHGADSDVWIATLRTDELPAECLLNEMHQIGIQGPSADEYECLP